MSQTYIGVYLVLAAAIFKWLDVEVTDPQLQNFVTLLLSLVGGVWAMWGRFRLGDVNALGGRK